MDRAARERVTPAESSQAPLPPQRIEQTIDANGSAENVPPPCNFAARRECVSTRLARLPPTVCLASRSGSCSAHNGHAARL